MQAINTNYLRLTASSLRGWERNYSLTSCSLPSQLRRRAGTSSSKGRTSRRGAHLPGVLTFLSTKVVWRAKSAQTSLCCCMQREKHHLIGCSSGKSLEKQKKRGNRKALGAAFQGQWLRISSSVAGGGLAPGFPALTA